MLFFPKDAEFQSVWTGPPAATLPSCVCKKYLTKTFFGAPLPGKPPIIRRKSGAEYTWKDPPQLPLSHSTKKKLFSSRKHSDNVESDRDAPFLFHVCVPSRKSLSDEKCQSPLGLKPYIPPTCLPIHSFVPAGWRRLMQFWGGFTYLVVGGWRSWMKCFRSSQKTAEIRNPYAKLWLESVFIYS